jgi:hypothetical protein
MALNQNNWRDRVRLQLRMHPLCSPCFEHDDVVPATKMLCSGEAQQSVCARHYDEHSRAR